jgi:undecaprenyl-diphosphatase
MSLIQSIILAIIEGLTEFLPVSSTGHMILAQSFMNIQNNEFVKTFEIVIQLGAILAVLVLYIKRFFMSITIYLKLFAAFLPTGIVGLLAYKIIKQYLFNPFIVSFSLIIGGVVLILLDTWSERKQAEYKDIEDINYEGALKIGAIQCISMIPGVSRAAATIFGGIFAGFDRKQAAEFSFLLAIPTMFAASAKDLWESKELITSENMLLLLTGSAVAFIVAACAVKAFVAFLTRYGFKYFGYYRILLGILFLACALYTGMKMAV